MDLAPTVSQSTNPPRRSLQAGVPPPLVDALERRDRAYFSLVTSTSTRDVEDITRDLHQFYGEVDVVHRSDASAHAVRIGTRLLRELNERRLDDVKLAAIVLDGTVVGRHTEMWALGVTTDGTKVPLGATEGPTETQHLVERLLGELDARGLDTTDVLWLTDGGGPVLRGVERHTGGRSVTQRCVVHKARNVTRDGMSEEERVALGRALVRQQLRWPVAVVPRREAIGSTQLADLCEVQGVRSLAPDDPLDAPAAKKILGRIGEDAVRERLYAAWDLADAAAAEAGLREVAAWLEERRLPLAAGKVVHEMQATLTLQRLGVADGETRRLMRTTNAIESVHQVVGQLKKRVRRWRDGPMRQRYLAVAVAKAERNWEPMMSPERAEALTRAVMALRHPEVTLEVAPGGDRAREVSVKGVAVRGRSGAVEVDAAVDDLLRWADRNGKAVIIDDEVVAGLPEPDERRRRLAGSGFVAGEGVIVREARVRAERGARPVRRVDEALGLAADAVGDDRRLLTVVGERALARAPELLVLSDGELELEAARVREAAEGLSTIGSDVRAWWAERSEAAALEAGAAWVAADREGHARPDPLADGRAWVMSEEQGDRLSGYATVRAREIAWKHERQVVQVLRSTRGALAELDGAVARVEAAGRAVGAAHVLELRDRIRAAAGVDERAVGPVARDAPEPQALGRRRRNVLGERRVAILTDYAEALAPMLRRAEDGTLLTLRDELGDPWKRLNNAAALRQHRWEELHRPARNEAFHDSLGDMVSSQASAAEPRLARPTVLGRRQRARDHAEGAGTRWRELSAAHTEIAELRDRPDGLDRFLLDHPQLALHHAVGIELDRRGRERSQQLSSQELGSSGGHAVTVSVGTGAARESVGMDV